MRRAQVKVGLINLCKGLCNNRTGLEDATDTTPHGDQRLHVQWWKAPDDGHSGVRNMLSNVE
jgi:hypothetical protein